MKGLNIEIKQFAPQTGNSALNWLLLIIVFGLLLCMLPLILLFGFAVYIYKIFIPDKLTGINDWIAIQTNTDFQIKYQWLLVENTPPFIYDYFDNKPLMIFETTPKHIFFEGLFTEFKIERSDGVFLQKIIVDETQHKIEELPLCFFDYTTQEYKKIKDLLGYEIDTRGLPDDFTIEAVGDEETLEIRIRKE